MENASNKQQTKKEMVQVSERNPQPLKPQKPQKPQKPLKPLKPPQPLKPLKPQKPLKHKLFIFATQNQSRVTQKNQSWCSKLFKYKAFGVCI